ncbi:MAG TPA: aminotransferase class IV [Cyclobacteriaceae bacterium]|nr:aminotransferase class IV [Cyclobacteriaceae bacterium]
MTDQLYFINGKILKASEAKLNINDLAILRGYGIFDFFRTSGGKPYLMEHYLDRFMHSAGLMDLAVPYSKSEIETIVRDLVRKNGLPESGIRMILTGGYSADGYSTGTPNYMILIESISYPDKEYYQKGIRLVSYDHLREWSEIKSINYLTPIKIKKEIAGRNGYDVLYHHNGLFLEVSRSNFFIIRDGVLITPGRNVLHGITRKTVIEISAEVIKIEERDIPMDELRLADEAFITGTTKRILPVRAVEDFEFKNGAPGPFTARLMKLYDEFEKCYTT